MGNNQKRCSGCDELKPVTSFYFRDATHTIRRTECKLCRAGGHTHGCRNQLAQIGLEITALFPGELAMGIRNGQLIADVTCRLLRDLARKAAVA